MIMFSSQHFTTWSPHKIIIVNPTKDYFGNNGTKSPYFDRKNMKLPYLNNKFQHVINT